MWLLLPKTPGRKVFTLITGTGSRLTFYTPDFFVRSKEGHYYLVETKGGGQGCSPQGESRYCLVRAASTKKCRWEYIYVPQGVLSA